eukprot:s29_g57.t1
MQHLAKHYQYSQQFCALFGSHDMPSIGWSRLVWTCSRMSMHCCCAAPPLPNGAFVAGSVKAAVLKAGTVATTGGQEAMVAKTYKQQMVYSHQWRF